MRARCLAALVLAVGLVVTRADAANTPFLKGAQPQPKTEQVVSRPEPARLEASSWRYFLAEGKELDRRIIAMSQRLAALPEELPPEIAVAAKPLIERIETQMDAYAGAKAQPTPSLPTPPIYQDRYTISQLLDLTERLERERTQLEAQRGDVASTERAIKTTTHHVDTQMAAYLDLAEGNPRRVLQGLELIANRLAIGVAEEQLRVQRAAYAAQQVLVRQLEDEQTVAIERLHAQRADLARLEAELWQAKSVREDAQEQLLKAQTNALSIAGDTPADKASAPYQRQQAVAASVDEAIAAMHLIGLQAEYQLASLLLDENETELQRLPRQVAEWDEEIADIRRNATAWQRDSQRERDRASEELASAPSSTENVLPITRVMLQDRMNLAQRTLTTLQRLESADARAGLLIKLISRELAEREGGLREWLAWSGITLGQLWDRSLEWIHLSLFKIGDTPVTALGLLRVAVILFVAWSISYWLRRALTRLGKHREELTQSALYTVERLSHYSIITLGFIVGLSSIGVDFTNFALVAGAIGIGIGFGLQSIVNNFVSGLILLFERTLKVGDFVELASGVAGEVQAINVRSTLIKTNDNVDIVVPNSEFMNTNVTNWTLMEAYRRIHIPFRVAYGTDIDLVTKAGLEAAESTPHTLATRKPGVWLVDFGESSLQFELVVWVTPQSVKRPGAVNAAYKLAIEKALREHRIPVPFPQRDLHLRSGFQTFLTPGPAGSPQGKHGSDDTQSRS
jgi:small-conductance mechanosensitive channel